MGNDGDMTIGEAIRRIEDHVHVHRIGKVPHIKIGTAISMAVAALQEKAERENGCPHCLQGVDIPLARCAGNKALHIGSGTGLLVMTSDHDTPGVVVIDRHNGEAYAEVAYCPVCGRRLVKDIFDVREFDRAPEWDGHTPDESIRRIGTLRTARDI